MRAEVSAGPNLEARARAARRAVLPPGAATGHTMDDQAETVLLRLLRGTGPDGLSAMRPGPEHPLLALRRNEALEVTLGAGLDPLSDPSNSDPRILRNRVRHELLPLCSELAGRDVAPLLARLALLAGEDSDWLAAQAADLDPTDASEHRRGARSRCAKSREGLAERRRPLPAGSRSGREGPRGGPRRSARDRGGAHDAGAQDRRAPAHRADLEWRSAHLERRSADLEPGRECGELSTTASGGTTPSSAPSW